MSTDPTRIDISFDPRERRMRGYARHGNTPFDVPFVSQITDNLWTGGCEDGLVLPANIAHVVSLYPWETYRVEPRDIADAGLLHEAVLLVRRLRRAILVETTG